MSNILEFKRKDYSNEYELKMQNASFSDLIEESNKLITMCKKSTPDFQTVNKIKTIQNEMLHRIETESSSLKIVVSKLQKDITKSSDELKPKRLSLVN
jgi:hypothetical protein